MNEKELCAYCAKELPKVGIKVAHIMQTTGPGEHTTKGTPDLLLIGFGRCHIWEAKSPEDKYAKLSADQQAFHADALAHGYFIPVIHSFDDALAYYAHQFVHGRRCPRCGYVMR